MSSPRRLFIAHVETADGVDEILPEFIYDIHVHGSLHVCPACAEIWAKVTVFEVGDAQVVPSEYYVEHNRCQEHGGGRLLVTSWAIGPCIQRLWELDTYLKWGPQTVAREMGLVLEET